MVSDMVIVAIPTQDDYVWKISSEKVPHLTLMNLGDSNNPEVGNIEEFLAHVVETSMYRFGLDVDRRGTLGEQNADVLFFRNPGYNVKNLETVRRYLLTNQAIFKAYNSTEQFPVWTPHLTLGYPESPAKKIDRDYPISWVQFDRVALWTGDYEGPEFQLKERWDMEMAMSDIPMEALAHYGVKGMKWGVHKDKISNFANKHGKETDKLITKAMGVRKDHTKSAARAKAREVGGLHKLSDKELQALNKRLEMEKKYKTFMEEDAKRRKEGALAIGKILGEVGKVALPVVLSAGAAIYIQKTQGQGPVKAHATVGNHKVIDVAQRAISSR